MKNPLTSFTEKHHPGACVVDGKLILSFPNALTPVVWQMDLGEAKASALEVRHQDGGTYVLTLKTPKGDVLDVAPFDTREQAVSALMAASKALRGAHGRIRPAAAANQSAQSAPAAYAAVSDPAKKGRWGVILGSIVFIVILVGIWGSLMPRAPTTMPGVAAGPVAGNPAARQSSGVPVSADDFLLGQ